jgi:hypothetical protein
MMARKRGVETAIVAACLDWLRLKGCNVWRQNAGAVKAVNRDGSTRFVRFTGDGSEGISDIIGLTSWGQFLAVECKRPGLKREPHQEHWQRGIAGSGGIALCVTSLAELEADWAEIIEERRERERHEIMLAGIP